ncbi:hypothetical protein C8R43DRAFT_1133605 [Mycena crocata]|nr:hypothetical protein C8R43DRAFT_1133605 [Mycena crocata]
MSFPNAKLHQTSILQYLVATSGPVYNVRKPFDPDAYLEFKGGLGDSSGQSIDVDLREALLAGENPFEDEGALFECGICWDTFLFPVVTACGHAFCYDCIHECLRLAPVCPYCRQDIMRPPERKLGLESELRQAIANGQRLADTVPPMSFVQPVFIPSKTDLQAWYLSKSRTGTHKEVLAQLLVERPSWHVSVERMRKMRQALGTLKATLVAIDPVALDFRDRGALQSLLHPGLVQSALLAGVDVRPDLQHVADFLQAPEIRPCGRFYERDANTVEWYYQIYCSDGIQEEPVNSVGSLFRGQHPQPRGRIVIAKNGPEDGAWACGIEMESLVKDLWWYMKSGTDNVRVAAEREMERILLGSV